jgi:peroxiredoxin
MALPEVGSPAPDLALLGPDEAEVRLSSYWQRRPTVVVFLRHFG